MANHSNSNNNNNNTSSTTMSSSGTGTATGGGGSNRDNASSSTTTTTAAASATTATTATPLIGLPTIVIQAAQQQQAAAAAAQTFLSNASTSALLQNTNAILDVVLCKLNAPYHIINDPRLLDCGHSACLQCIVQLKDSDKNLKCVYCNSIHKIPLDTNKLTVNKNLQTFIKYNFKHNLNQNFLKQFEDSMCSLEEKFQSQTASAESLDQYLNLVESDIHIKIENMKASLEKMGEQFIQNIRTIRKELQKKIATTSKDYESKFNIYRQFIDNNNDNLNQYQIMYPFTTATAATVIDTGSKQAQQHQQQQQHLPQQQHHHTQQQQHLHVQQQNHHLSHPPQQQQQQQQQQRSTNLTSNVFNANLLSTITNVVTASNLQQQSKNSLNNDNNTNLNSLNAALNGSQANNYQNFSNSSSFHEDLDDLEAELNVKPVNSQSQKRHLNKEQAQFNKFVREEVTKRFGENFLLQHEVNQLESSIMDLIKNEAIQSFLPKNTAPARAWTLAKVSLRSLKRDLRRKQTQCYKKPDLNQKLVSHSYFDSPLN